MHADRQKQMAGYEQTKWSEWKVHKGLENRIVIFDKYQIRKEEFLQLLEEFWWHVDG